MATPTLNVVDTDEIVPAGTDEDIKRRVERFIASPPRNSRVFTITPYVATWVLEKYNLENRPIKPNAIARFADDMEHDAWEVTGDTLKFSDKTRLRDGQNRLRACVRAGRPFTTHVVFGVPDEAFSRMDRGKLRSGLDVLAIAGYQNAGVLAGAVRHVRNLLSDNPSQREGVEPHDALRLMRESYPTLIDFIPQARAVRQATGQPVAPVTALLYVFAQRNRAKAEDFALGWASGKHVGKYSSIGTMEKAFSKLRAEAMGRVHETARFAFIITGWNLYLLGNKGRLTQFRWEQGQPLPLIES